MECLIGEKTILSEVPKLIHVGGRSWILAKDSDNKPVLYDAICPHQNGVVSNLKKKEWICPNHLWKFETSIEHFYQNQLYFLQIFLPDPEGLHL